MTSSTFNASTDLHSRCMAVLSNKHLEDQIDNKRSVYLIGPFFDLTFVCGGLVLALAAICINQFGVSANAAQQSTPIMALGIIGTFLLSGPHTGATLVKLYGEKENRLRFYYVSFVLPAVLVIALTVGLFVPFVAKVEALVYLMLVWHHYMAQSYGIAMMYCARAGMHLLAKDKFLARAILHIAVTVAITQQFTPDWQRTSFLNIPLAPMAFMPTNVVCILQGFLVITIAAFLIEQLGRRRRGAINMPLPAMATLLTCGLFLTLGRGLSDLMWLFVPNFFHSTQYLAVVLAERHKKESDNNPSRTFLKSFEHLGDCFGEFFLLGLLLFSALPFVISRLGFPFYLTSALVFFALSFHHFAADACIWKPKKKPQHLRSRL